MEQFYAVLRVDGRYSKFIFKDTTITFIHSKDLIRYLDVKEWDNGCLVVDCLGAVKGEYEDYIDMTYILELLYMDSHFFLSQRKGVKIQNE